MKNLQNFILVVSLSLIVLVVVWSTLPLGIIRGTLAQPLQVSEYESRKALLRMQSTQPFSDDLLSNTITSLDSLSFEIINSNFQCPKPISNTNGWSVEMRTGGRPFMNFDNIQLNGKSWDFNLSPCTTISPTLQVTLTHHYTSGKKVNRLWFIHKAGEGDYPTVVVMTSDGFFNIGGAEIPKKQGAAARMGFIGEPFSLTKDYFQHVDNVNITEVDTDTIRVIYDVHSQAGEGVLEFEIKWITATMQPELHFRSAHVSRLNTSTRLGFAGFNFMRGPTLSGLFYDPNKPTGEQIFKDGILAFHDGRSVYVVPPSGPVVPELLIPPIITTTVISKDIVTNVFTGSKLIMDQPQNVNNYFSKHPVPGYEQRTDLILKLDSSTTQPLSVRRVQTAVDLKSSNPEANETVNVFYAANMMPQQLYEFSFTLEPAALPFEEFYQACQQGVVFISDRFNSYKRLYFLPLAGNFLPAGPAEPLTDGVIKDPQRPSISPNKRFVIFDADEHYDNSPRQRIYTLDLANSAVHRLTLDSGGNSNDWGGSLSPDYSQFAMITDRRGSPHLNVENLASGRVFSYGNSITPATSIDWSRVRNEIVFANSNGLWIHERESGNLIPIISGEGIRNPKFSPHSVFQSQKIAYAKSTGIYIIARNGSGNRQVLTDGDYPTWVNNSRLIIQRTVGGNTDLYLLDINTGQTIRLTTEPGLDVEPAFISSCYVYLPIIGKNWK